MKKNEDNRNVALNAISDYVVVSDNLVGVVHKTGSRNRVLLRDVSAAALEWWNAWQKVSNKAHRGYFTHGEYMAAMQLRANSTATYKAYYRE